MPPLLVPRPFGRHPNFLPEVRALRDSKARRAEQTEVRPVALRVRLNPEAVVANDGGLHRGLVVLSRRAAEFVHAGFGRENRNALLGAGNAEPAFGRRLIDNALDLHGSSACSGGFGRLLFLVGFPFGIESRSRFGFMTSVAAGALPINPEGSQEDDRKAADGALSVFRFVCGHPLTKAPAFPAVKEAA